MRYKTSWENWDPVGEDADRVEVSQAGFAGGERTRDGAETSGTLGRLLRYTGVKGLTLLVTVAVGLYLTILIVNLGGYVDEIFKAQILEAVAGMTRSGWPEGVEEPERTQIIEQTIWEIEEARGLHEPFLTRSARWLVQALMLNLGHGYSKQWFRDIGAGVVRDVIRERLPYTLVLVGISNIVLFISTIWASLLLSRKHGGLFDRLNVLLLSLTSAPSWIHGVVLILVFAGFLGILPFPRTWDELPEEFTWELAAVLLKHLVLPAAAILIAGFFQSVYAWRAFFMIFRHEDYVEIARAKGLRSGAIEWSYIVRPTLPYVLTSFATMMILFWQGSIALEMVFRWPGIGPLFMMAARSFNTPLLLGIVVIFAYLLALTVFVLEIAYALADPRVRVGSSGNNNHWRNTRVRRRPSLRPAQWLANVSDWLQGVGSSIASIPARLAAAASGWRARRDRAKGSHGDIEGLSMEDASAWEGPGHLARLWPHLRELARSPSAIVGAVVILGMIAASIYIVVALPRDEVVALWRGESGTVTRLLWYRNPRGVPPTWTNYLRREKLPTTIDVSTQLPRTELPGQDLPWLTGLNGSLLTGGTDVSRVDSPFSNGVAQSELTLSFDYPYRTFPQDVAIYVDATYTAKMPYTRLTWIKPDGEEIDLGSAPISSRTTTLYMSQESRLRRKFGEKMAVEGLFLDMASETPRAQAGTYHLVIDGAVFEEKASLDAELVVLGRVAGLAGTDNDRRDLMVGLTWGLPVALAFGLLGTLGTTIFSMTLAAVSVWFGGWVDGLIQRLTDLNMILPMIPIIILVYIMYSKSIWAILGVVVLLSIFGSAVKNYRSAFLQLREAPYIEAGLAYGASGWRIISRYLVPRILPMMVPQMAILVPSFVFLEATLAFLGVFDPVLPTWGKVINEAVLTGNLIDRTHWILEPVTLLALTGLAFASLGFALERVLNPRLRQT